MAADAPTTRSRPGRRRAIATVGVVALIVGGATSVRALTANGAQDVSQSSPQIEGAAEHGDYFAAAVAVGDFDNDGRDDIVVGAPFEDVGSISDAGIVHVLYGTSSGVGGSDDVLLHQGSPGVPGVNEAGDMFGASLAVGDFDDDGYDDVAIGVVGEDSSTTTDAGTVQILFGSSQGLTGSGAQWVWQGTSGVHSSPESYDEFGYALAAGDFDDDGYDDLAVGVPGEALGSTVGAGAAHVLYGSSAGLTGASSTVLHQDRAGVPGVAEIDDWFGSTLAVGDFDDDGVDDLAVGLPGEALGTRVAAGGINVFFGSSGALQTTGSMFFSQNTSGVPGTGETDDSFGAALAAGDFDDDGYDDLAVGVPGEALGSATSSGMINVLYGTASGLTGSGSAGLSQNSGAIPGGAEAGDEFGLALGAADFDADGHDDLVVGSPGEGRGSYGGAGGIHVLYGASGGLTTSGSEWWAPGSGDLPGQAEANAGVGRAIATGDVDGDGRADVVVGGPGGTVSNRGAAGSLLLIFG